MGAKKLLGEAAQLVLDQNYSVTEAAQAMNVGKSTMDKWVRQLKQEWSTKIGQNLS